MGCVPLGLSSREDISNVQRKYLGKRKCRKKPAPYPLNLETETTELKDHTVRILFVRLQWLRDGFLEGKAHTLTLAKSFLFTLRHPLVFGKLQAS